MIVPNTPILLMAYGIVKIPVPIPAPATSISDSIKVNFFVFIYEPSTKCQFAFLPLYHKNVNFATEKDCRGYFPTVLWGLCRFVDYSLVNHRLLFLPLLKLPLPFLRLAKCNDIRQQTAGNLHTNVVGNLWWVSLAMLVTEDIYCIWSIRRLAQLPLT